MNPFSWWFFVASICLNFMEAGSVLAKVGQKREITIGFSSFIITLIYSILFSFAVYFA